MIREIKQIDKSQIFKEKKKESMPIFTKFLNILGYGKKG